MKIWRVETADGVGPYQRYSGKTEDQMAFTNAILDWMDENENALDTHPTPLKDGIEVFFMEHFCGFSSLADLELWFGEWTEPTQVGFLMQLTRSA